LGLGDAKLFAGAGAWVSWQGLPSVLLLAAAAALAWQLVAARRRGRSLMGGELPFGPYLATALWLVWLYGPIVVS
jgi:leader peptidase (prepilin peptidase)/N-methyltransferase